MSEEDIGSSNYVAYIAAVPLVISMFVYGIQKLQDMIIYPSNVPEGSRTQVDTPEKYGMEFEDIKIKTTDGEELQTYILTVSIFNTHTHTHTHIFTFSFHSI